MTHALILFVRKPEKGKVKTRIATTEGDDFALAVYQKLLAHTHSITIPLACTRYVFYAGTIEEEDMWSKGFEKALQTETDLGNRMKAAFAHVFGKGHKRICIIGSDCYELSTELIEDAFLQLEAVDVVIGPALDGGYYLLGMKDELKDVFQNIDWSTEKVRTQTILQLQDQGYTFTLLPLLQDVDTIEEVPVIWKKW